MHRKTIIPPGWPIKKEQNVTKFAIYDIMETILKMAKFASLWPSLIYICEHWLLAIVFIHGK
jgi:hypothetical protein